MLKYTPVEQVENVNVASVNHGAELVRLLLGVAGVLLGIYVILGLVLDACIRFVPASLEKPLAGLHTGLLAGHKTDPVQEKRLQAMVDRLAGEPGEYTVHVVKDNTENAVSLPGGHIVFYTGLLEQLGSEDEVAFVLGHELGHFEHRDHLRGMGRGLLVLALTSVITGSESAMSQFSSRLLQVTDLQFSRQQEIDADTFGMTRMAAAHYNPHGAVDFLSRMERWEEKTSFLSTHPGSDERRTHALALLTRP